MVVHRPDKERKNNSPYYLIEPLVSFVPLVFFVSVLFSVYFVHLVVKRPAVGFTQDKPILNRIMIKPGCENRNQKTETKKTYGF
jgi:hypothetical protein